MQFVEFDQVDGSNEGDDGSEPAENPTNQLTTSSMHPDIRATIVSKWGCLQQIIDTVVEENSGGASGSGLAVFNPQCSLSIINSRFKNNVGTG